MVGITYPRYGAPGRPSRRRARPIHVDISQQRSWNSPDMTPCGEPDGSLTREWIQRLDHWLNKLAGDESTGTPHLSRRVAWAWTAFELRVYGTLSMMEEVTNENGERGVESTQNPGRRPRCACQCGLYIKTDVSTMGYLRCEADHVVGIECILRRCRNRDPHQEPWECPFPGCTLTLQDPDSFIPSDPTLACTPTKTRPVSAEETREEEDEEPSSSSRDPTDSRWARVSPMQSDIRVGGLSHFPPLPPPRERPLFCPINICRQAWFTRGWRCYHCITGNTVSE